jgi:hypothetical protein
VDRSRRVFPVGIHKISALLDLGRRDTRDARQSIEREEVISKIPGNKKLAEMVDFGSGEFARAFPVHAFCIHGQGCSSQGGLWKNLKGGVPSGAFFAPLGLVIFGYTAAQDI